MAVLNGTAGAAVMMSGGQCMVAGSGAGYVNEYRINQDTCVGCNLCSRCAR